MSQAALAEPSEPSLADALEELRRPPASPPDGSALWISQIAIADKYKVYTSSSALADEMTVVAKQTLSWKKQWEMENSEYNRLALRFDPEKQTFGAHIRQKMGEAFDAPSWLHLGGLLSGLSGDH